MFLSGGTLFFFSWTVLSLTFFFSFLELTLLLTNLNYRNLIEDFFSVHSLNFENVQSNFYLNLIRSKRFSFILKDYLY